MPVPKPRKDEDKNKFISRCIKFLKEEDPNMENEQAVAICNSEWKERKQSSNWKMLNFSVPIEQSTENKKDFLIKGVAINSTLTRNGVEFIPEELQLSATSLRNKPILKDHTNSIDSIVGRTTQNVNFNTVNQNVDFEAKIMDESIKEKIKDGRIQSVSVGAMVSDLVEAIDEEGNMTHLIAKGIDFVELSLVAVPADPNAGLAQAIKMSYDLKQSTIQEKSLEPVNTTKKMVEEKKEKVEQNSEVKVDLQMPQELTEALKSISEGFKTVSERLDKLEQSKEEPEEQPEEVVDETKGEVGDTEVTETVNDYANFNLERTGRMFSLSMNTYPDSCKRLNRGEQ